MKLNKKRLIIGILFLLILPLAQALLLSEYECKKNGQLEFVLKADNKSYMYTDSMKITYGNQQINGTWNNDRIRISDSSSEEYATFTSEEDTFLVQRTYDLKLDYEITDLKSGEIIGVYPEKTEFNFDCPGLLFTCTRLNISIDKCYTNSKGIFRAYLTLKGLEQAPQSTLDLAVALKYQITAKESYKTITGQTTSRGELPEDHEMIKMAESEYILKNDFGEGNYVEKIWLGIDFKELDFECKEKDYPEISFYDFTDCNIQEEEIIPEPVLEVPVEEQEEIKEETTQEIIEQETQPEEITAEPTEEEIPQFVKAEQEKNKNKLIIMIIIFGVIVLIAGGIIFYLSRQGYL